MPKDLDAEQEKRAKPNRPGLTPAERRDLRDDGISARESRPEVSEPKESIRWRKFPPSEYEVSEEERAAGLAEAERDRKAKQEAAELKAHAAEERAAERAAAMERETQRKAMDIWYHLDPNRETHVAEQAAFEKELAPLQVHLTVAESIDVIEQFNSTLEWLHWPTSREEGPWPLAMEKFKESPTAATFAITMRGDHVGILFIEKYGDTGCRLQLIWQAGRDTWNTARWLDIFLEKTLDEKHLLIGTSRGRPKPTEAVWDQRCAMVEECDKLKREHPSRGWLDICDEMGISNDQRKHWKEKCAERRGAESAN